MTDFLAAAWHLRGVLAALALLVLIAVSLDAVGRRAER